MPSPFPGMDPYLEGDLWTTVHAALIGEIARELGPRLRPRYVALTEKRFVMALPEVEDGVTITAAREVDVRPVGIVAGRGIGEGVAMAVSPPPLRLATIIPTPVPHYTVEIRDVANRQLVTLIKLLSPTNKRGEGREEYLARRQHLLRSRSHLMEIDLLRLGHRLPMRAMLPASSYYVFLCRAEVRPMADVWPVALDRPLPIVWVPLLAGDADLLLDLQAIFTRVYDTAGYDLIVDYTRPPEPPLPPEATAWAKEQVKKVIRPES